ncbi:hypothetical protein GCM10023085_10460 [Actinomadura viridis]|uniref:Uncharacterized protein n=1 Tax=Actinomadura viridis TaxID=58110 RepID=A0A931GLY9_9ACTN|nr:hypothetical protein [Actinomadura viridis]MBG6092057.1 hypothetical protein [Actinomadura viridis]
MADGTTPTNRLAVLGAQLSSRGYEVEWTQHGMRVINSKVPACCPKAAPREDSITLRRRPEDFDNPWFWTVRGEPLAQADRITDAILAVVGLLAHRHPVDPPTVDGAGR